MNHLSPQPEAAELARELHDKPDALHALTVLNEATNREEDESAPPIPEDLRKRWKARFGPQPQPESVSFFAWLKAVIFPESPALRGAWAFALVLFVAGGAFMMQQSRNDEVVLRGGTSTPSVKIPTLIVIGTVEEHAEFRRRWSGAAAVEVAAISEAESRAAKVPNAFIADVARGEVSLWAGSQREETRRVEEAGKPVANIVRTLESWVADLQK